MLNVTPSDKRVFLKSITFSLTISPSLIPLKYVINLENVDKEYYAIPKEKKSTRTSSPSKRVKFQESKSKKK